MEGPGRVGQTVDGALGSRSHSGGRHPEATGCGVERQVSPTGAQEVFPGDWQCGVLGDPCPGSLTLDLPTTPRCQSPRGHTPCYCGIQISESSGSPLRRQRVHSRMRCFPGTSKSTAGASDPALRMSRACARNLVPPVPTPAC